MALFSTAYWPPVSYMLLALQSDLVQIERYESYQKQSYRNRCLILSANGPLALTVPVLRPHNTIIKDTRIDYSKPWQQMHWRAIEAAYRSSAYYEEYQQEIRSLYQKEPPFLFDLNLRTWEFALKLSERPCSWAPTTAFMPRSDRHDDYRRQIDPKKERRLEWPACNPYFQVFGQKFGFVPDLSVLDLLFNEGQLRR